MSTEQEQDQWRRVCPVDRFPAGEALRSAGCPAIALFVVDGEFFATDDVCSHGRSSLAEGFVDGPYVECVLHGAQFDVRTGAVVTPPATGPLRTYPVRVDEGVVYVRTAPDPVQ